MTKRLQYVLLAMVLFLAIGSCTSARTIKSTGLKGLKLGDPMPEEHITRLLGHPAHDSLIEEGGYAWRAMVVEHPSGMVLVESDFSNQDIINRIQIMASDLRFQKRIAVGSRVASLDELGGRWYISHLADYGKVDIAIQGLHFLIADDFLLSTDEKIISKDRIPRDSPILSIVLM